MQQLTLWIPWYEVASMLKTNSWDYITTMKTLHFEHTRIDEYTDSSHTGIVHATYLTYKQVELLRACLNCQEE